MTLIDKAEALLPCPFCGGVAEQDYQQPYRSISAGKLGKACTIYCTECSANMVLCHEDHPGVSPDDLMAELVAAWNRRAAIPARGVGVKPQDVLNAAWRDDLGEEGRAMYDRILAALDMTNVQKMHIAAIAPTDAAQEREAALVQAALDNKEQLDIWAQEILEGLGFADVLKIESYDDKIEAHSVIGRGIVEVLRALIGEPRT